MKSCFICYSSQRNVREYASPGAVFVSGPGNALAPEFQAARDRGALLLQYARPITLVNWPLSPLEVEFYMGDRDLVPTWGNGRQNNDYGVLTNLRVGSIWADHLAEVWLPKVIQSKQRDGVVLDVLGARPWGKPKPGETWKAFDDWPAAERAEWTAGAVDLMRRLHEVRMQLNPRFRLVCNNFWDLSPAGNPSDALANTGAQYCDGVMLEHKGAASAYHVGQASREYSDASRRLVLAITHTVTEALAWAAVPGVTHVSAIDDRGTPPKQSYGEATPPIVESSIADWLAYVDDLILEREALLADVGNDDELRKRLDAMAAELSTVNEALRDVGRMLQTAEAENLTLSGSNGVLRDRLTQINALSEAQP